MAVAGACASIVYSFAYGDEDVSANVRIQPETYAKLKQLARRSGTTMPQVLAEAVEKLYRSRFVEDCNRAYARLKAHPKTWKKELEEREAWESTIGDGLANE